MGGGSGGCVGFLGVGVGVCLGWGGGGGGGAGGRPAGEVFSSSKLPGKHILPPHKDLVEGKIQLVSKETHH